MNEPLEDYVDYLEHRLTGRINELDSGLTNNETEVANLQKQIELLLRQVKELGQSLLDLQKKFLYHIHDLGLNNPYQTGPVNFIWRDAI